MLIFEVPILIFLFKHAKSYTLSFPNIAPRIQTWLSEQQPFKRLKTVFASGATQSKAMCECC